MNTRVGRVLILLRSDGPRPHALLRRLTLRDDAAEDLMQDLFLRLSDSDGFHKADDATGYAIRTATNLAFEWRPKRNRRRETQVDGVEPEFETASPLSILEQQEQYTRILNALDQMSVLTPSSCLDSPERRRLNVATDTRWLGVAAWTRFVILARRPPVIRLNRASAASYG